MPVQRSRLQSLPLAGHAAEVLVATEPDLRFAAHWHDAWSVGAIGAGECRFACDGQAHHAHADDVIVMPPFAVHTAGVSTGRFEMVMLYLPISWVDAAMGWPPGHRPLGARVVRRDAPLAGMLGRAVMERRGDRLAAAVALALERTLPEPAEFIPVATAEPRVQALCEALQADPPQTVQLDALAREIGLSREHAHRLFRRAIGLTPREYERLARIAQAKRLLREGSSIAHAAADCGFADQAHFSRWFRRYFGVTPAAYEP